MVRDKLLAHAIRDGPACSYKTYILIVELVKNSLAGPGTRAARAGPGAHARAPQLVHFLHSCFPSAQPGHRLSPAPRSKGGVKWGSDFR